MKKVSLNLNGENTLLGGPGPRSQLIIDFIKSIPHGKYFDIDGISKVLKVTRHALDQRLRPYLDEIDGHMLSVPMQHGGRRTVYGSKSGIIALKKQLQDAGLL